jgi:hypothetical protein
VARIGSLRGGAIGLIGVWRRVLDAGGEVFSASSGPLATKEFAHAAAPSRIVDTMHERKALMARLSDGFLALRAARHVRGAARDAHVDAARRAREAGRALDVARYWYGSAGS